MQQDNAPWAPRLRESGGRQRSTGGLHCAAAASTGGRNTRRPWGCCTGMEGLVKCLPSVLLRLVSASSACPSHAPGPCAQANPSALFPRPHPPVLACILSLSILACCCAPPRVTNKVLGMPMPAVPAPPALMQAAPFITSPVPGWTPMAASPPYCTPCTRLSCCWTIRSCPLRAHRELSSAEAWARELILPCQPASCSHQAVWLCPCQQLLRMHAERRKLRPEQDAGGGRWRWLLQLNTQHRNRVVLCAGKRLQGRGRVVRKAGGWAASAKRCGDIVADNGGARSAVTGRGGKA